MPGVRRLATGLARPALTVLVVLAFTAHDAGPARAQTVKSLVSNTDQTTGAGSNKIAAQSFTTGPGSPGHEVTEIRIYFVATVPNPVVRLREDDGGEPGNLVATFINPASVTREFNTFTAPSGTVLDAETTYWITLNEGPSETFDYGIVSAADETGEDGWSIGDTHLVRSDETSDWGETANPIAIGISGLVYPATALGTLSLAASLPGNPPVALSRDFASERTSYSATVDGASSSVALTMTTRHPGATVQVWATGSSVVASQTGDPWAFDVALKAAFHNRIDVIVTSEDAGSARRYRLRVLRRDVPPTLVSAVVAPRGASPTADTVYLRYDRALRPDGPDPGNPLAPPPAAFSVAVDGSPVTVTSAQINGNTVALRLAEAFGHRVRRVTVSYAPPSVNPVQTTRAGLARALTDHPVEIRIPPSGPGTGGADGTLLLDGLMTVGYDALNEWGGYTDGLEGTDLIGSLSPTGFRFKGADYVVAILRVNENAGLRLDLHRVLTKAAAARLALYVGGTRSVFQSRNEPERLGGVRWWGVRVRRRCE